MGFMQLFNRNVETRTMPFTDGEILGGVYMIGNYGSVADVQVTPATAMTSSAVLAIVGRIARDIATLPVHVVDRDGGRQHDHPVARRLRNPNPYMTPVGFWTSYAMNLLLWGNAYAAIERDGTGASATLPMLAKHTRPRRKDGELFYETGPFGVGLPLRADQVCHTQYLALDGICGQSPITLAAKTIGVSVALQDFAARYFSQGSHLDQNAFELPPMNGEALTETRRILQEQFSGASNQHKRLALPGLKVHKLNFSMRESQASEARAFQLREVGRVFNMPIGIIDPEASTYGNLEAQYANYSQATLRPLVVAIEQEFNRKLFTEAEQDRLSIKFNLDAVVRASLADRMEADSKGVQAGILTPNEARAHHDLPPIDGGDALLSPLNMTPAAQRSEVQPEPAGADPITSPRDDRIRKLITSIALSIATKEANAATRAARKPETFNAWADEFFQTHASHIAERLPIVTQLQAEAIAQEARTAITTAHESGTLDALLTTWQQDRPTQFLTNILTAN